MNRVAVEMESQARRMGFRDCREMLERRADERRVATAESFAGLDRRAANRREANRRKLEIAKVNHWMQRFDAARIG